MHFLAPSHRPGEREQVTSQAHRIGDERRDNTGQRAELGAALRDYANRLTFLWRYSIVTGPCADR